MIIEPFHDRYEPTIGPFMVRIVEHIYHKLMDDLTHSQCQGKYGHVFFI